MVSVTGMQSMQLVGHGGLKEGQVINKLLEEYQKREAEREMTDEAAAGHR